MFRIILSTVTTTITIAAIAGAATPVAAQNVPDACMPIVGTFLYLRPRAPDAIEPQVGRILLSLTDSGQAMMTDSAQGGVSERYQPFSEARGGWTCRVEGGDLHLDAVLLDFTFPTVEMPVQKLARVDITGVYDRDEATMKGDTLVSFFPLDADPLNGEAGENPMRYRFTGFKIVPPH
ncbi:hypothetical protein L1787_01745 [Acuticoccus sp. M5D2P5]|uniref:hypothetical protein n=1 Tax=Acuticoccus kalidii TaxID=2910977 RepID=UPI001F453AA7|nr:hypothetical protein [Acuticoccus kalidii]MCF3932136.1 hypothetical protein [Acuticoccus kalidii]